MTFAERQAARRRRQNEAEVPLKRLRGDIRTILAHTENLYAAMYDPLSPAGRQYRVEHCLERLLKAVHAAAYAASPDLTPAKLQVVFPIMGHRVFSSHDLRPTELRTGVGL